MRTRKVSVIIAGICMMLLIFDSKTALEGAKTGVDLCVRTVVPSLFPFFALSMIITASADNYDSGILKRLACLMQIPGSAARVLFPSLLGGYPVGAKCVAELYRNGTLKKQEAERLLAFCSNAGPSFLFGMVSAFFPNGVMVWKLWLIHIGSAILTSLFFPVTGTDQEQYNQKAQKSIQASDFMMPAVKAISVVCGWVIIFRIAIAYLDRWIFWRFPQWFQVLITGILELSNGCCELLRIQNVSARFILCGIMLSFGGICVFFQTLSVTNGLSLRNYILGKSIQTLLACILCCIAVSQYGMVYVVVLSLAMMFLMSFKNKSGNLKEIPV